MRIVYEGNYIRMTCGEIALVDECLFYYFELICLFVLMLCVAANIFAVMQTFPCPPRLNQYLEENKVSYLGHYKVLPVNILKITIL